MLPISTNKGTDTVAPVSTVAGLEAPVAVSPLKPGSVSVTSSSTLILHSEERVPEYLTTGVEDYLLPERAARPQPPLWTTLYIGKGKKDKINKVDIAGFLYKKGGLTRDDVGNIDVHDYYAYVAVSRALAGRKNATTRSLQKTFLLNSLTSQQD